MLGTSCHMLGSSWTKFAEKSLFRKPQDGDSRAIKGSPQLKLYHRLLMARKDTPCTFGTGGFFNCMGLRIQDSSEEIFSSYGQTGRSSLLSFTQSFDFDSGDRLFDREPWKSAWIQAFTKTNLNPNSLGMDSR